MGVAAANTNSLLKQDRDDNCILGGGGETQIEERLLSTSQQSIEKSVRVLI